MNRETLEQQIARESLQQATRRHFLNNCATGLGAIWLATQAADVLGADVLGEDVLGADANAGFAPQHLATNPLSPLAPPHEAKVKRVIYLHMVGAPSQLELFDYKPDLNALNGKECPSSFLEGKRFAFINGTPKMLGHQYKF